MRRSKIQPILGARDEWIYGEIDDDEPSSVHRADAFNDDRWADGARGLDIGDRTQPRDERRYN